MNSVPTGFSAVPPVCPPATDPVRAWPSDRCVSVRNGQRRPHGVVPTHTLFPRGSAPWERQVQRGLPRLWFPVLVPGPLSVQRWTALGSLGTGRTAGLAGVSPSATSTHLPGRKERGSRMGQSPAHSPGSIGPALVPRQNPAFTCCLESCSPCLPLAASRLRPRSVRRECLKQKHRKGTAAETIL